jgi:hypothetical protein
VHNFDVELGFVTLIVRIGLFIHIYSSNFYLIEFTLKRRVENISPPYKYARQRPLYSHQNTFAGYHMEMLSEDAPNQ